VIVIKNIAYQFFVSVLIIVAFIIFLFVKRKFNSFFFRGRTIKNKKSKIYNTPLYFELFYISVFVCFAGFTIWSLLGQKWYYLLINIVYLIPILQSLIRMIKSTDDQIEISTEFVSFRTRQDHIEKLIKPTSFEFTQIQSDRLTIQSDPKDDVIIVENAQGESLIINLYKLNLAHYQIQMKRDLKRYFGPDYIIQKESFLAEILKSPKKTIKLLLLVLAFILVVSILTNIF
jgi:hypothetical protein